MAAEVETALTPAQAVAPPASAERLHPGPVARRPVNKWRVLVTTIFGLFMVILDSTVVNVAFQTLREEFHAGVNESQWIISIYVLALGITTPLAGFLSDRFGIKRIYLSGLTCFVLGSVLCGLAPSLPVLAAFRALQGIGGGIALPLGSALVLNAFPAEEQGVALGFFGIAMVLAPTLGPILGGLLVDHGLWRWIFFINLPVGLIGVSLGSLWLPHSTTARRHTLDTLGLATSVVGFGAVLYASSIAADEGWTSPGVIGFFALGILGLLAFVFVELFVSPEPLLDLRLFQRQTFLTATLVGWVSVIALFGAEFLLPLYLQALRGLTALQTGFMLLPMAIAGGVITPLAGRVYDKVGPRPLVVGGYLILLVNTWQLAQLGPDTTMQWILFLLALRGIAVGLTVQSTFVTALSVIPKQRLARGSSLVNSTRQVVQSIGVALLATVLTSTLTPDILALQQQFQNQPVTPGQKQPGLCEMATSLAQGARIPASGVPGSVPSSGVAPGTTLGTTNGVGVSASAAGAGLPALAAQLSPQVVQLACDENVRGFEKTYKLTFYAAVVALLLALLLPGWPQRFAGRRAGDTPAPAH